MIFDPASSASSDLSALVNGQGYWINVSTDCVLYWETHSYNLYKGWNLIGWQGSDSVTPTATPAPVEAMQYVTGDDTIISSTSGQWVGQTFHCYETVTISGVRAKVSHSGSSGSVQFYLADEIGDAPHFVITSNTIDSMAIGVNSWVSIPLPATLTAGTDYVVYYRPLGMYSSNVWFGWWADGTSPSYQSGVTIASAGNGSWTAYNQYDLMFQIY